MNRPAPTAEHRMPPKEEAIYPVDNDSLVAFPIEGDGTKIQLARVYNQTDQKIDFEDSFWSRADSPNREEERIAMLVTASGKRLYFRGDEAIDLKEDDQTLILRPMRSPKKTWPPVTIGKKFIYSDGEPIVQVCVAEGVIDPDQDPDAANVLNEWGIKLFSNPFEGLNNLVEQLEEKEHTKQIRLGGETAPDKSKRIQPIDAGTGIIVPETPYSTREVLLLKDNSNILAGRYVSVKNMTPEERLRKGLIDTELLQGSGVLAEIPKKEEQDKKSRLGRLASKIAVKGWAKDKARSAREVGHEAKKLGKAMGRTAVRGAAKRVHASKDAAVDYYGRFARVNGAVWDEIHYGGEGVSDEELKENKEAAQKAKADKRGHKLRKFSSLISKARALRKKTPESDHEVMTEEEAFELLSYVDVSSADDARVNVETAKNSPSARKYAGALIGMAQEVGKDALTQLADKLRAAALEELERLGITPTVFGGSISWAMWDLAKQRYLSEHPEESHPDYTLHDPLAGDEQADQILEDIVNRRIGWEYDMYNDKPYGLGVRNPDGQLRSIDYARLGRRLRSE